MKKSLLEGRGGHVHHRETPLHRDNDCAPCHFADVAELANKQQLTGERKDHLGNQEGEHGGHLGRQFQKRDPQSNAVAVAVGDNQQVVFVVDVASN